MSSNVEEEWAIFPFDQASDGRRWVKLIEDIDVQMNRNKTGSSLAKDNPVYADNTKLQSANNPFDNENDGKAG